MKHFVSFMVLCMVVMPSFAATPAGTGRRSMQTQMVVAGPRRVNANDTAGAIASMKVLKTEMDTDLSDKASIRPPVDTTTPNGAKNEENNREKEKSACIQNNIGVGNTFVWASRYSNTANYTTMVEDVENPENNTCFVKVDVKSSDPKINIEGVPSVYYEMGHNITCGAWADEDKIEKQILDAKKDARTWATVGGAVGGAAIGVTSMELFGNKLLSEAGVTSVQGQKALDSETDKTALYRSQLLVLKKENEEQYKEIVKLLKDVQSKCENTEVWGDDRPTACGKYKYKDLLIGVESAQ